MAGGCGRGVQCVHQPNCVISTASQASASRWSGPWHLGSQDREGVPPGQVLPWGGRAHRALRQVQQDGRGPQRRFLPTDSSRPHSRSPESVSPAFFQPCKLRVPLRTRITGVRSCLGREMPALLRARWRREPHQHVSCAACLLVGSGRGALNGAAQVLGIDAGTGVLPGACSVLGWG